MYELTDAEKEILMQQQRGIGLLFIGSRRLIINFEIPQHHFELMGTGDGHICTYADIEELEFFFCKFVKNGRFMTKGEIFVRVQDDPFNFTGDYLDLVYYALYQSYKSDNDSPTPKPPNQDSEVIAVNKNRNTKTKVNMIVKQSY